jgi:hypothetical protein
MGEPIREAIQAFLDTLDGGWTVTNFCIPMGIERVNAGEFESTVWMYEPPFQPNYTTDGLLMEADRIQNQYATVEEDGD